MSLSLNDAVTKPVGHLSRLSSEELFALKHEAARQLTAAKAAVTVLDQALNTKYADRAQRLRLEAGKDCGAVTFVDELVKVTAELPKTVEWDQALLAATAQRIAQNGDDPREFIETTYRVSETKYNAWNAALRKAFDPARTVKTGKPNYKLVMDADAVAHRAEVMA
jgi:hypothetical protein